jgi:hypothetical protein
MAQRHERDAGPAPPAEFARPFDCRRLGDGLKTLRIAAKPAERAGVARRLDLERLDALDATLELKRRRNGLIDLTGRLVADLAQRCVVTLDPVPARLDLAVHEVFGDHDSSARDGDEALPVENGYIDLGETLVQILAEGLDPYPRAPGAAFPAEGWTSGTKAGKS